MSTDNAKMADVNVVKMKMPDKILNAASELFSRKGFDGTSMRDIAKASSIRPGSIYYYFSSKDAIFREVLEKGISPVIHSGEKIVNGDIPPPEKLKQLLNNHLRYIIEHHNNLVIYFQEKGNTYHAETDTYLHKRDRYEGLFRSVLTKGIETGDFNQVDVPLTAFVILGMCNWIIQWYNPEGPKSIEEIVGHMIYLICDLMINAMCAPDCDLPKRKGWPSMNLSIGMFVHNA
jgi:TetR/AcrR family transcriptional regulator, cholesterol catabolism regulator